MALKPYMLKADEGLTSSDLKASKVSTGGMLTLIESYTDGGAPLHVHANEDEAFYVIEGTITVKVGDEQYEAGPRSFVFLPRGIPHAWDVVGERARVLMITVPAMLEEFLTEFHAVPFNEPDAVATKYGIKFLRE
jgi:quercetin dioxygenase-like cupin family protein